VLKSIVVDILKITLYMNTIAKLPSGKILDISRFVALIPILNVVNTSYDLILEGCSTPINIEANDAHALEQLLESDKNKHQDSDAFGYEQEQLKRNQRPLELLAKRIELHRNMSKEESQERQELFEEFKQIIDAERQPGQKLYSEK
jgi:Skp family chaperone for outer membrane proteins